MKLDIFTLPPDGVCIAKALFGRTSFTKASLSRMMNRFPHGRKVMIDALDSSLTIRMSSSGKVGLGGFAFFDFCCWRCCFGATEETMRWVTDRLASDEEWPSLIVPADSFVFFLRLRNGDEGYVAFCLPSLT